MLRLASLVFLVPVAALAIDAKNPGDGWAEANREDEFVIFTKDDAKAGARALIAITEIDAAPDVVFSVVGDFVNYPKFMPYIQESKVIEQKSELELVAYARLDPPLVDERDYYIEVKRTPGPQNGGVWKSAWTAVPEKGPERADVVRVKLNTGSWVIEPLDGGKRSRVTYNLLTHPGGSIPNWIANKSNTVAIPDLFKAVRKRSAEVAKK